MARTVFGPIAEPSDVAEAIYHAQLARRRMLVLGPVGKLSLAIVRAMPPLYDWLMARNLRPARRG